MMISLSYLNILLLYPLLILFLCIPQQLSEFISNKNNIDLSQKFKNIHIEVAIIAETDLIHKKHGNNSEHISYIQDFIHDFDTNYYQLIKKHPIIELWPPVYTKPCKQEFCYSLYDNLKIFVGPTRSWEHNNNRDKRKHIRGLNLAHEEIWRNFYHRLSKEQEKSKQKKDFLIVFEDDAYPRSKNHVELVLKEILNMIEEQENFKYLGWCFLNLPRAPYCNHAYAMDVPAARELVLNYDPCGLATDMQLPDIFATEVVKFNIVSKETIDTMEPKNKIVKESMSKLGGFYDIGGNCLFGDGIYAQRSFTVGFTFNHENKTEAEHMCWQK